MDGNISNGANINVPSFQLDCLEYFATIKGSQLTYLVTEKSTQGSTGKFDKKETGRVKFIWQDQSVD